MKRRLDWLVIEHLSAQAGWIQGESSFVSDVQTKLEPPPLGAYDIITIVKNGLEMRKLWPPQIKGGQELKKKQFITEQYKG
jgi:hypothetical protein